jgi:hypothetical protein
MKVQKTQTKRVVSLAGTYIVRRIVQRCAVCGRVAEDPALRQWVAHGCNTAWDVLVFVGQRLFKDCRSIGQVQAELKGRDVVLSESQIAKLGRKFILYLALAHRRATPRIKLAMARRGGYILHLDAVHQEDAPALMSVIDGLSRLVLANVKAPSEHTAQIIPFLEKIKGDYGNPIACVHDMGTGICKAVEAVFPASKDFVCHFHFLRDAGKDLIEPAYGRLRSCLRRHALTTRFSALAREARLLLMAEQDEAGAGKTDIKTTSELNLTTSTAVDALSLWCLQAKHSGDGYGFPFDRPLLMLAERLLSLLDCLPQLMQSLNGDNLAGNRLFLHLTRKVVDVIDDPDFETTVEELRWRCNLFDQLRQAMRIAVTGGRDGLNDEGEMSEMDSIRKGVSRLRRRLDTESKFAADPLCCKLAEQIDKYGEKLFADPIHISTLSGPVLIYPQRTNNILEQFFRSLRRDHRRRTGDNRMHRALQTMLADTPLVKNLSNPEYMETLLNGQPNLPTLFADLDQTVTSEELKPEDDADRVLPGFRALTKMDNLPDRLSEIASAMAIREQSNQIV